MKDQPQTCKGCKYLLADLIRDQKTVEDEYRYFCGHYDLFEIDVNEADNFIGFQPVLPDWCPLKFWNEIKQWFDERTKQSIMHYMILEYVKDDLEGLGKWNVKHYTHDFDDFDRMSGLYPESKGFVHMIDVQFLKSHEIMLQVKALRERNKVKA